MKKIIASIFILALFASCTSSQKTTTTPKEKVEEPVQNNKPVIRNNFPVK